MIKFFTKLLTLIGYIILTLIFIAAASLVIDFILWIWDIDVRLWR